MLKVYTDLSVIPEGVPPAAAVLPFTAPPAEDARNPDADRWKQYLKDAPEYLQQVATPEEADVLICPVQIEHPALKLKEYNWQPLWDWSSKAYATGKPVIGFLVADFENPIGNGQGLIYKTSGNQLWRRKYEFGYPAMVVDIRESQPFTPVQVTARPSVSFCGCVSEPRVKPVQELQDCKDLTFNCIPREKVYGFMSPEILQTMRKEYIQNMEGCTYALCSRGVGNFSYRIYEVMSAGRIPVYIDTAGLLPLEKIVPWKELMVWVQPGQNAAEAVLAFHETHTPQELAELQMLNREWWKTWLSPEGFHCRGLKRDLQVNGYLKDQE